MWLDFFIALGIALCLLFVPGLALARCLRLDWRIVVFVAPACSLALYCVLGVVYGKLGIFASGLTLFWIPLCLFACALLASALVRRKREGAWPRDALSRRDGARFAGAAILYVAVGSAVGMLIYVYALNGPNSFVPEYDNLFHYNMIRAILESGSFSTLDVSCYLAMDASANPMPGGTYPLGGYYPIGWHILSALVADVSGCSVACAANAVNYAFVGFLFPLGVCQLVSALFPEKKTLVCGALCVSAFAIFPWHLLAAWPLFPNLTAFCLVPSLMAFFVSVLDGGLARLRGESAAGALGGLPSGEPLQLVVYKRPIAHPLLCFAVSCVACGSIHPSSIFTAALLLAPLLVWFVGRAVSLQKGVAFGVLAAVATCAAIVLAWFAVYSLPAFSRAVDVFIAPRQTPDEALSSLFDLSFTNEVGQPFLVALVLVGAFAVIVRRRRAWLVASLVLAGIVYWVSAAADDSVFKHVLAGFWYTESKRTGCIVGLAALPLATYGASFLFDWASRAARKIAGSRAASKPYSACVSRGASAACACAFLLVLYAVPLIQPRFGVPSALGNAAYRAQQNYNMPIYTAEEVAFVDKVKAEVGDDLVINLPYDGSVIAYGINDLPMYYLEREGYGSSYETAESRLIRTKLCDIADDPSVADAVAETGARYLLLLECSGDDMAYGFDVADWTGISSVTDETPGFSVVLAEGDMRLYRIDAA